MRSWHAYRRHHPAAPVERVALDLGLYGTILLTFELNRNELFPVARQLQHAHEKSKSAHARERRKSSQRRTTPSARRQESFATESESDVEADDVGFDAFVTVQTLAQLDDATKLTIRMQIDGSNVVLKPVAERASGSHAPGLRTFERVRFLQMPTTDVQITATATVVNDGTEAHAKAKGVAVMKQTLLGTIKGTAVDFGASQMPALQTLKLFASIADESSSS